MVAHPADDAGRRRRIRLVVLVVALAWIANLASIIWKRSAMLADAPGSTVANADVAAYWAAARLALEGRAVAAFDRAEIGALQRFADSPEHLVLPWLYPPAVHLFVLPLGLLSFTAAWIVLNLVSMAALGAALHRLDPSRPILNAIVLFSPATLFCAVRGQLSILFAAAIVTAGAALLARQPMRAGLWLALATLKPPLALILPTTVLAGRAWRFLAGGAIGVALLSVVPLALFGPDYWERWFEAVRIHSTYVREVEGNLHRMMSWYALFWVLDVPHEWAMVLQGAVSLTFILAVAFVWMQPGASTNLKFGALAIGMIGAAPYAWSPDSTIQLVGFLFLLRAGGEEAILPRAFFAIGWIAPVIFIVELVPLPFMLAPLGLAAVLYAAVVARRQTTPLPA